MPSPSGADGGSATTAARTADVSVVVPVLNEEVHLPRLLASLDAQTVRIRELIIVDAGSTDGTEAISRAAGARWLPDGGLPGISRNQGAEVAVGRWLLFLDADVRLPPTAIEEILEEAEDHGLDAASCAFVPDLGGPLIRLQHWLSSTYFRWSSRLGWAHSIGGFLFVKRELHGVIGGFDSTVRVAEDQDYAFRLARAGRYAFTRRPVVEISVRRFRSEGLWTMSVKWIGIELHRAVLGEVRGDRFRYFQEVEGKGKDA